MPEKPFEWIPKEDLLSYEQMFKFIKVAISNGIKKIRITGGEPLVRDDLDKFISMINEYAVITSYSIHYTKLYDFKSIY